MNEIVKKVSDFDNDCGYEIFNPQVMNIRECIE